jgi:hypothetical protein
VWQRRSLQGTIPGFRDRDIFVINRPGCCQRYLDLGEIRPPQPTTVSYWRVVFGIPSMSRGFVGGVSCDLADQNGQMRAGGVRFLPDPCCYFAGMAARSGAGGRETQPAGRRSGRSPGGGPGRPLCAVTGVGGHRCARSPGCAVTAVRGHRVARTPGCAVTAVRGQRCARSPGCAITWRDGGTVQGAVDRSERPCRPPAPGCRPGLARVHDGCAAGGLELAGLIAAAGTTAAEEN